MVLGGHQGGKGLVLERQPGQNGDVPGGGVVLLGVEAVGVDIVGTRQPQFLRAVVHQGDEGGHVSRYRHGQDVAGVVGGGHQRTVKKLQDVDLLPHLQVLAGAPQLQVCVKPLRYGDHPVQGELSPVHRL